MYIYIYMCGRSVMKKNKYHYLINDIKNSIFNCWQ